MCEHEQKTTFNRGVLGWIVGILLLAVLTWILYETLYKPMFGIYAFLLGAFTGIMLYRKLMIKE